MELGAGDRLLAIENMLGGELSGSRVSRHRLVLSEIIVLLGHQFVLVMEILLSYVRIVI